MGERQFYGAVAVGERGQIVIPKEAREEFGIRPRGQARSIRQAGRRDNVLVKSDGLRNSLNGFSRAYQRCWQ